MVLPAQLPPALLKFRANPLPEPPLPVFLSCFSSAAEKATLPGCPLLLPRAWEPLPCQATPQPPAAAGGLGNPGPVEYPSPFSFSRGSQAGVGLLAQLPAPLRSPRAPSLRSWGPLRVAFVPHTLPLQGWSLDRNPRPDSRALWTRPLGPVALGLASSCGASVCPFQGSLRSPSEEAQAPLPPEGNLTRRGSTRPPPRSGDRIPAELGPTSTTVLCGLLPHTQSQ